MSTGQFKLIMIAVAILLAVMLGPMAGFGWLVGHVASEVVMRWND